MKLPTHNACYTGTEPLIRYYTSMWILIVMGLAVAGIVAAAVSTLPQTAYAAGKRDGLREAADFAHDRADAAVQLAPKGQLQLGLVRAQVADNIALELRSRANEVKR